MHQEAVELRLQAELDANLERPARRGLAEIVLAVPVERLRQRVRLQRLRRILAEHAGREVADDLPLGVFDGDRHVGGAVRREFDLDLAAGPDRRRLTGEGRRPSAAESIPTRNKGMSAA